jgi:hypothetical protein
MSRLIPVHYTTRGKYLQLVEGRDEVNHEREEEGGEELIVRESCEYREAGQGPHQTHSKPTNIKCKRQRNRINKARKPNKEVKQIGIFLFAPGDIISLERPRSTKI